ncbi:polysaccharide deacteylase family 2 protein [Phaeobacter gallaeciensis]|uniref:polysaccharide deacteylase family 2 protein n=1 Tax=Phaeobacter gallaeciensis TaxID=60890 RepID=UPI00237F4732|nr:polysaccharide deacteylase family 2 protein [Phaeobacter gallaeciensis]MDE4096338.1 divergent polysaccharide deacetylase family protein [Phaeobacter gallaeciensis]MDE4105149.1 divergent polysaccharide deacetylase family protein [Phaeobacter gallaeciensis]MDE4109605.1 divergent polysaccharide deacetylase family protein [Phaeobacter gallaeciensis]MDE4114073.1 divergent polysaccharide deacetylase family protein [Phaeobacter gallaeciensis]MDE4118540.1 divergent polysaccharide deacetylase family
MRGFLGGVSIGALVAVCGAAMWSLSTPLPRQVDVSATGPEKATVPQSDALAPIETPQPDADLVEAAPVAPETAPADDLNDLTSLDTEPAARPEVGPAGDVRGSGDADLPDVPEAPSEAETAAGGAEPGMLPETAESDDGVEVSMTPAPTPEAPDTTAEVGQSPTDSPAPGTAPEMTAPQGAPEAVQLEQGAAVPVPQLGSAPDPTTPPVIAFSTPEPAPEQPEVVEAEPKEDMPPAEEAETEDAPENGRIAALPTADGSRASQSPQIGTRVVPLTERDSEETAAAGAETTQQPFDAYSEPFAGSDGRPLMSIVLIDDETSVGAEALVDFPYPLSFAIDPEDPRATEKMAARRAAGFEVLILSDLPREAMPQDAETAMEVWLDRVPQALGILEGVETGVQGNRPLADQVSDVARTGGYGLVLQNSGLNTVQKLALRDGVPSGVVFRDFDGAGQNPRAIRRFLDQAAFRAGQEGAVIMLGRLQPDTISALLLWGLQDRASRVALAPVSASLRANLAATAE